MTGSRRDVDDLRDEIQELFADLWQVPRFSGIRHRFRPQLDCFRTDDPPELHVVVELAGVSPDQVEVAVSGSTLAVDGRRERPSAPGARHYQMEIEYGRFQRRIELGVDVDPTGASAAYERGLLTVVLPIAERASAGERVTIEVRRS
jgi:HSP20 family molecular chaperone IbpA